MDLQALAAVITRKMGCDRHSFPKFVSVLFGPAFAGDKEANASEYHLTPIP